MDQPTTPWLRRGRFGVALALLAGAVYAAIRGLRAATDGDVLGAVTAACLCLAFIALDYVAATLIRMGGLVLRNARRLEEMQTHIEVLEIELERSAAARDHVLVKVDELIAADLNRHRFPRLASHPADAEPGETESVAREDQSRRASSTARQPATESPSRSVRTSSQHLPDQRSFPTNGGQDDLDRVVRKEMTRLRSAFAEAVRSGDFAASLHIGERICRLFPDSSLALEYLSIREQLLRRQAAHSDREPIEAAPFA